MEHYVHHLPGRLRIRTAEVKGNLARARDLESLLKAQKGVEAATVSPLTGSVLVHYDPGLLNISTLAGILRCPTPAIQSGGRPTQLFAWSVAGRGLGKRIASRAVGYILHAAPERGATALIAAIL